MWGIPAVKAVLNTQQAVIPYAPSVSSSGDQSSIKSFLSFILWRHQTKPPKTEEDPMHFHNALHVPDTFTNLDKMGVNLVFCHLCTCFCLWGRTGVRAHEWSDLAAAVFITACFHNPRISRSHWIFLALQEPGRPRDCFTLNWRCWGTKEVVYLGHRGMEAELGPNIKVPTLLPKYFLAAIKHIAQDIMGRKAVNKTNF